MTSRNRTTITKRCAARAEARGSGSRQDRPTAFPKRAAPAVLTGDEPIRVLFTCVGRRVELIRAFRRAATQLDRPIEIHGADADRLSPALHHMDTVHLVSPISSGAYVDELLRLAKRHKFHLLIPLIDDELPHVSEAVDRFMRIGCVALVSSAPVVQICRDKLATYAALTRAGIDTPRTWTWSEVRRLKRHRFPYFLKPRFGSAAMGNYVVRDARELDVFGRRVEQPVVQEFVDGIEHTLDVYVDFDGRTRCVVPRRRIEVRSGEVSKGLIVKDQSIMAVGRRIPEVLGACRGVITAQCIVTPRGRIRVIEVNPRFGGGVPLSIHAGADFPKWILTELLGERPRIRPEGFRNDIAMLRYDESVFVPRASRFTAPDRSPFAPRHRGTD